MLLLALLLLLARAVALPRCPALGPHATPRRATPRQGQAKYELPKLNRHLCMPYYRDEDGTVLLREPKTYKARSPAPRRGSRPRACRGVRARVRVVCEATWCAAWERGGVEWQQHVERSSPCCCSTSHVEWTSRSRCTTRGSIA